jgi:hypothetical protein
MADKQSIPVIINDSSGESRAAMPASVWLRKVHGYNIEDAVRFVEKLKANP